MVIALMALLALQDAPLSATVEDSARVIHFERKADGRVILQAPAQDPKAGERAMETWEADSPKEFKQEYPELVRKYDLEPLLREARTDSDFLESFESRLEELQRNLTESWRKAEEKAEGRNSRLGMLVGRVTPALRSQLGLKEKEGILIMEVMDPGTAHRAGLKKHDIVTGMNGTAVTDVNEFVRTLRSTLEKEDFTLELLREGKRIELEIKKIGTGSVK